MRPALSLVFAAAMIALPRTARAELSCDTPCTGAVYERVSGAFYDVGVDCATGGYSAGTGTAHPTTLETGASQNVIFGATTDTTTSQLSFFLHELSEHYSSSANGAVPADATEATPSGSCVFDPPDTAGEPDSVGVETEWQVLGSDGSTYTWRHEVVTFGDAIDNAGIRLTQSITTDGAGGAATVGLRWQVDYQSGDDDGPVLATVSCDPYAVSDAVSTEQGFSADELDDFVQLANNVGAPLVETYTSTTPLDAVPGTATPDQLVYGGWSALSFADWGYAPATGSADPDADSAVLFYFGADAASGAALSPGVAHSRSLVLFAAVDGDTCGGFIEVPQTDTGAPDSGLADTGAADAALCDFGGGFAVCGGSSGGAAAVLVLVMVGGLRRREERSC